MQYAEILSLAGLRVDGRGPDEIRKLSIKVGGHLDADGSAYVEQGLNKVVVLINGPAEPSKRSADTSDEMGKIVCHIMNAPFSGPDWRKRRIGDRKTIEMENNIVNTFEAVLMLEQYPRSQIDVIVHVIESDGSILCTIINAVSLALMDAGIAMRDIVCSASCGMIKQTMCIDLNQAEQSMASFFLPMAIKARTSEIVFIQLDSRLTGSLEHALSCGIGACMQLKSHIEAATVAAMAIPDRLQNSEGRITSAVRSGRHSKAFNNEESRPGRMEIAATEN